MRPVITSRLLKDFNPQRRTELCKCLTPCKNVILIVQDEFVHQVCEKEAVGFASDILLAVGKDVDDPVHLSSSWKVLEEQRLISYVLSFGGGKMPYGAYTQFATMIGKSRKQVKDKVSELRRYKRLPPIEK